MAYFWSSSLPSFIMPAMIRCPPSGVTCIFQSLCFTVTLGMPFPPSPLSRASAHTSHKGLLLHSKHFSFLWPPVSALVSTNQLVPSVPLCGFRYRFTRQTLYQIVWFCYHFIRQTLYRISSSWERWAYLTRLHPCIAAHTRCAHSSIVVAGVIGLNRLQQAAMKIQVCVAR